MQRQPDWAISQKKPAHKKQQLARVKYSRNNFGLKLSQLDDFLAIGRLTKQQNDEFLRLIVIIGRSQIAIRRLVTQKITN